MTSTGLSSFTYSPELISQALALIWESDYRKQRATQFVLRGRVFQLSATAFAVESKKFLKTLNRPSKLHIVHRRLNSKPYDLMCDCYHAGVHPSPFNACSHILAVFIATTLKDGDVSLLTMRDDARRKEQEAKEVPIVGNEYPDHTKQKTRLYNILNRDDWYVEYEKEVQCNNWFTGEPNKYPYSLDVFGAKRLDMFRPNDVRVLVGIEIHREETGGGHGSKITGPKDRNRADEIREQHNIKVIAFNVSHLKAATDEMILKEIYQKIGV